MIIAWQDNDDEFFDGLFAYLKGRFDLRLSAASEMQNNTASSIYYETIVALESVHRVLRKVVGSSAPTLEKYKNAVKEKNEEEVQAIIDFYKKLALIDKCQSEAFKYFRRDYFFDPVIRNYSTFLDQDFKLSESFQKSIKWDKDNFDPDKVFGFIEAFKYSISESQISRTTRDDIVYQNELYENLVRDFDELINKKVKIGVSVFDIELPSSLKGFEHRPKFLSTIDLARLIESLQIFFAGDDAVLITVNHSHVINNKNYILSYLVIYKATVYKSPKELFIKIKNQIIRIIGSVYDYRVNIENREDMIDVIYPHESFTGTLSSNKEKIAFRDKFLKYFLSSIFLINIEENPDLDFYNSIRNLVLNNYRFFREKLYSRPEQPQVAPIIRAPALDNKPPAFGYLVELADQIDQDKLNKFFSCKELPLVENEKLKLIAYLYKQQGITNTTDDILGHLIKVEFFLARLISVNIYPFNGTHNTSSFENAPKLAKLSLLFQQFVLLSALGVFNKRSYSAPLELNTKAIYFIDKFSKRPYGNYRIEHTRDLKRHLEEYKTNILRPSVKQEQQLISKASKKVESIKSYLSQLLKKDVIIFRFIFKCGSLAQLEYKLFDDMFRDYIDNLKRRSTEGLHLEGHVGIYIPHLQEHYIDATLFFGADKKLNPDIETQKSAVIAYWENYVQNKQLQINSSNLKQPKKTLGGQASDTPSAPTNPFAGFRVNRLTAHSIPVVKTEHSLNHVYVEVYQGQSKIQKLLTEKVALYYANCHLILCTPEQDEASPRKNGLILGRIRLPREKVKSEAEKTESSSETLSVEDPISQEKASS